MLLLSNLNLQRQSEQLIIIMNQIIEILQRNTKKRGSNFFSIHGYRRTHPSPPLPLPHCPPRYCCCRCQSLVSATVAALPPRFTRRCHCRQSCSSAKLPPPPPSWLPPPPRCFSLSRRRAVASTYATLSPSCHRYRQATLPVLPSPPPLPLFLSSSLLLSLLLFPLPLLPLLPLLFLVDC